MRVCAHLKSLLFDDDLQYCAYHVTMGRRKEGTTEYDRTERYEKECHYFARLLLTKRKEMMRAPSRRDS